MPEPERSSAPVLKHELLTVCAIKYETPAAQFQYVSCTDAVLKATPQVLSA